jgi:hypothetical protein
MFGKWGIWTEDLREKAALLSQLDAFAMSHADLCS